MRNKNLIVLLTLVMIACAVGIIVLVLSLSQPSNSSNVDEAASKGGQVNTPASAPVVTGPVAPTPAPSLAPTALPTATPTQPPATVPATVVATPTATATPTPPLGIIPVKFKIPAIGVDTFVERVGVDKNGDMDVPKNIWNVAWFGLGYNPGQTGNAVIAGHLDGIGTKAVFWDLDKLKPGDQIIVIDGNNQQLTFEVINSQSYPYNNAPLQTIFGPSTEAHLNLITCSGVFDNHSLMYNNRLIVFTRLVATSPTPGTTPTVK